MLDTETDHVHVLRQCTMVQLMEQRHDQPQFKESTFFNRIDDAPCFPEHKTLSTNIQYHPIFVETERHFNGWRFTALCSAIMTTVILFTNIGLMIWLRRQGSSNDGLTQVYKGSCGKVRTTRIWLHLVINALSTLLLGASNYCMQCLSSPTRSEVDMAHSMRNYLDIGVDSVCDLNKVAAWRTFMWCGLAISSLPLHLLYNSAFYDIVANNDYDVFLVNHSLVDSGVHFTAKNSDLSCEDQSTVADLVITNSGIGGDFQKLGIADCIEEYTQSFITGRRNLLLVSRNATGLAANGLRYLHGYRLDDYARQRQQFNWPCCSDPFINQKSKSYIYHDSPCEYSLGESCAKSFEQNDPWTPYGYDVDYCLSEQVKEACTLNANYPVFVMVVVCNAIKVIITFIVALVIKEDPLITVGDAVESFLDGPDQTTAGCCWMGKVEFARNGWSASILARKWRLLPDIQTAPPPPMKMDLRKRRWRSAVSRSSLLVTYIGCALIMILAFLLMFKTAYLPGRPKNNGVSGPSIAFGSFGQPTIANIIIGWSIDSIRNPSLRVTATTLVANAPQLVLSLSYYNINSFLTSMYLTEEWTKFARERQYLRVSNPKGNQRSTRFLHLPYKISIQLLVLSTFLHWLVSQSIYLVVVSNYSSTGQLCAILEIASCGISSEPMIITAIISCYFIFMVILLGSRRLEPGIPIVGSCSAAISAACHPPRCEDRPSRQKVQYGAIPGYEGEGIVGHCSISSGEVEAPIADKLYAGL